MNHWKFKAQINNHSIIFLLFQLLCIPQFHVHDRQVTSTKKDQQATQTSWSREERCKDGMGSKSSSWQDTEWWPGPELVETK